MNTRHVSKPIAVTLALLLFGSVPLVEQSLSGLGVDLGASAAAAGEGKGQGKGGAGKAGGSGGTGGPQYKGGKSGTATTPSVTSTSDSGDEDSDKRGPKYMGGENSNKPGDGDVRGGKPAWAQEGIPDGVELGRLNVARAPDHVLERQYLEALNTWVAAMSALYKLSAEDAAKLLETQYDSVLRFDSPLMNLALYKDIVLDGTSGLEPLLLPDTKASNLDLAAIFLGSASDKTVAITVETVKAINLILDLNMTDADAAVVATKAEDVREAIFVGHD